MAEQDVTNLMREIDESVRAERLRKFWQRFSHYIVGASIAVVLGTVGWVIWQHHVKSEAMEATLQLLEGEKLEKSGKFSEAADVYGRTAQAHADIAPLARVRQALALADAGRADEAHQYLQLAAGKRKSDPAWKDYARLLGAAYALKSAAGKEPKASGADALHELSGTGRPFSGTGRELLALRLTEEGKTKEARDLLDALAQDAGMPQSLRDRAGHASQALASREDMK